MISSFYMRFMMQYSSFIYILYHQYSVLQCFLYRAVSSFIYILYHLYSLLQCFLYRKVEIMIYLWNPQLVVLVRQAKVCHGCLESTWFPSLLLKQTIHITICRSLKGTVQRDFRPLVFFIIRTSLVHWPMG